MALKLNGTEVRTAQRLFRKVKGLEMEVDRVKIYRMRGR